MSGKKGRSAEARERELLQRELEQLNKLRCSCPAFGGVNDFCPIHGQYLKVSQQRETNK
jgi:hypothetical protein